MSWGLAPTKEPSPRGDPSPIVRWRPRGPSGRVTQTVLSVPASLPSATFVEVLDGRRSIRDMTSPPQARVGELLWHALRVRLGSDEWQSRAAPSAGGIHAVEAFIIEQADESAHYYDPVRHHLLRIDDIDARALAQATADVRQVLSGAAGAVLLLAADERCYAARYTNPLSLMWRDAGALIAIVQLVATSLGLASCPIGVLGGELCAVVAPDLTAVGVIMVGVPARS